MDEKIDANFLLYKYNEALKNSKDSFEKADYLRHCTFLLLQDAIQNKCSEKMIGALLEDNLTTYFEHVSSIDSDDVNNYTQAVANRLKSLNMSVDPGKISFKLDPENYLKEIKCTGEFENCRFAEVKEENLKIFRNSPFRKNQPTHSPVSSLTSNSSNTFVNDPNIPSTSKFFYEKLPEKHSTKVIQESDLEQQNEAKTNFSFRTAHQELCAQNLKRFGRAEPQPQNPPLFSCNNSNNPKKRLGARRTVQGKFVLPVQQKDDLNEESSYQSIENPDGGELVDERLKNIDPKMIELISNEIMHKYKTVEWHDIAGLEYAKATIQEAVVWPLLRPDVFTGLRRPPRGILLFGPPGTGKTLIGKCIASQSKSTFFSISASSLTSKWIGDGEKMVRALFAVAAVYQPSVVFIDEIDSLLCQRSETEHESSRRIKTEFLVQLDGAATSDDERILIVGATNRPQELDEAARRRLVRRLYIPLPELNARLHILKNLLSPVKHNLNDGAILEIGKLTEGYSGADMESLCREASMEPIRSISPDQILHFNENEVRPISFDDFRRSLGRVRPSVSQSDLAQYIEWNKIYGAGSVA